MADVSSDEVVGGRLPTDFSPTEIGCIIARYDFHIQIVSKYFLVEVKGIRQDYGGFRMTENEFVKAKEYKTDFGLVVVSNLNDVPKMTAVFDPLESLVLDKKIAVQQQVSYHSRATKW